MALYRYVKHHHAVPIKPQKRKARFPLTSAVLMLSGLVLIAWVLWPILSFELLVSPSYGGIVRPVPDQVVSQALDNQFGRFLGTSSVDYTKASNWFPKSPQQDGANGRLQTYTLSIPKLGITSAMVTVGGDDLNRSLIHYGGTALPGEYGNVVIFGHSVLPVFFNPKNYLTIFSTLPTLVEGDEIYINADGIRYKYIVYAMQVVSPDDVSVLEQKYDWSYISIITCAPPGTYWKRLIVRARLEKL